MKGRRIYPDEEGHMYFDEGDYGRHPNGTWYARPPGSHAGNLSQHDVTEHEDGTITVAPSILITNSDGKWHGYLERGVWREV